MCEACKVLMEIVDIQKKLIETQQRSIAVLKDTLELRKKEVNLLRSRKS